jgi:hypothetical protein
MLAQNKLIRVRKKAFRQRQKYARGWIWSRQNIFVATIQCHFYCLLISDHIAGGDSREYPEKNSMVVRPHFDCSTRAFNRSGSSRKSTGIRG